VVNTLKGGGRRIRTCPAASVAKPTRGSASAGQCEGELPRGPEYQEGSGLPCWFTPARLVSNPRREQSLEGDAPDSDVFRVYLGDIGSGANATKVIDSRGSEGSAGGKSPEGKTP
jgi:hypothetical protein